jgi:hypothetical protein
VSGENRPSLRVSDTDRDEVAVALREHAVAGRLTLDEFSERIDRAYAARTGADLEAVTSDLPELAGRPPASRREPKRFLGVVFGGGERRGRWRVGRRFFCLTMFGGSDVDLRQAEIDGPAISITAFTMWGGFDLYVPTGVDVDMTGFALFGGNDEHGTEGEVRGDAPLVRVRAITIFGGADVWHVPRTAADVPFRQLRDSLSGKALPPGTKR